MGDDENLVAQSHKRTGTASTGSAPHGDGRQDFVAQSHKGFRPPGSLVTKRENGRRWEPVIGLEIHVQLKTKTKMFCRCPAGFGAGENTQTCPVCLGFPGALPVANRAAVEWTILLGLALGCGIADRAVFARKNYFYPDLPKGYQISQYDLPLCINGKVAVPTAGHDHVIGIVRAHLEEDAAKTIHVGGRTGRIGGADYSLVDYNRGGTPLVEIVTAPDIHSTDQAKRFLQLLRQTIVELGVSDAEMEKGTLRVDANVSVRPAGSDELRTRTEIKNMNSFNFIARGIGAEVERQIAVWESGGEVKQETYDFDAATGRLTPRRAKEEADDYRYFPEPDLVPIEPPAELVEQLRAGLPELPAARIRRLEAELDLERAVVLVTGGLDALWEKAVAAGADRVAAANVVANNVVGAGVDPGAVPAKELARLVDARDRIPRAAFDEAIAKLAEPGFSADPYLVEETVSDTAELGPIVARILEANDDKVAAYRSGKEGLLGFFVGQVMRETQGKANPRVVSELVRAKLSEG
ncbi:MAG TPA: Asp-tRNA(Asn)/Glu-tRNA(Gln) amidotransferase subunit GatB [Gaiellaceae bacterium]|nr:Asp-tRNA(Asn)/Glu-tRNA(Gln) amidotransferase subunit GatB [Gaiellaceae bacterium]